MKDINNTIARLVGFILTGLFSLLIGLYVGSRSRTSEEPRQLTDWEVLEMAIIKTESDFNPLARGTHGDLGIFQGTEIWVEDVNRIVGEPTYIHTDCLDIDKSLEMFNIIQNQYNPRKDLSKAVSVHNPGGDAIGYSIKVRKNMDWVRRYEEIRSKLK